MKIKFQTDIWNHDAKIFYSLQIQIRHLFNITWHQQRSSIKMYRVWCATVEPYTHLDLLRSFIKKRILHLFVNHSSIKILLWELFYVDIIILALSKSRRQSVSFEWVTNLHLGSSDLKTHMYPIGWLLPAWHVFLL